MMKSKKINSTRLIQFILILVSLNQSKDLFFTMKLKIKIYWKNKVKKRIKNMKSHRNKYNQLSKKSTEEQECAKDA
jgi:lysozyme family protein